MDKSRIESTIFFKEKISFSLKLFSDHFYGQFFIKTIRGPWMVLKQMEQYISIKQVCIGYIVFGSSLYPHILKKEVGYDLALVHPSVYLSIPQSICLYFLFHFLTEGAHIWHMDYLWCVDDNNSFWLSISCMNLESFKVMFTCLKYIVRLITPTSLSFLWSVFTVRTMIAYGM